MSAHCGVSSGTFHTGLSQESVHPIHGCSRVTLLGVLPIMHLASLQLRQDVLRDSGVGWGGGRAWGVMWMPSLPGVEWCVQEPFVLSRKPLMCSVCVRVCVQSSVVFACIY